MKIGPKIPVVIHPVFFIMAVLIGWLNSQSVLGTIIWTSVIFISVLVHEFGHALTALLFGQRARIDLVALGGLTQRSGRTLKLWQEFIIVLNGPFAGLLLCIAAYMIKLSLGHSLSLPPVMTYALNITIYANLFWTIINLLPVLPLDGGRLMGIICEAIFGFKGIKIGIFISFLFSVLLAIFFFIIQSLFAGCLFLLFAFESYRTWRSTMSLTVQDQDMHIQDLLKQAEMNLRNGRHEEAQEQFLRVRQDTQKGILYIAATQYLAQLYFQQGKYKETYDLLFPIKDDISPDILILLHQSAYRIGEWQRAIELGDRSYRSTPNYDTALLNALCYAILGQEKPAVGWLQCSLREGLPNLREILRKKEFDKIRQNSHFQQLLKAIEEQ
jgi:Zn-dependent protease